jgi:hypothetical protein
MALRAGVDASSRPRQHRHHDRDKPGGNSAQEGRWLTETLTLTNDGTEYVEPGRVVLPILTASSHHVPHLQLADLVVAASTAAVAGRKSGLDLTKLRELVEQAAAGTGSALVIGGIAGIGKTAVLDAGRALATECGMRTLATVGVPSASHLPFAGLHQLL